MAASLTEAVLANLVEQCARRKLEQFGGTAAIPAGEDTPMPLKIIAGVSLVSWLGVLWAGRMLPFLGAGVGAGL